MTKVSKNSQTKQSCKAGVMPRFFVRMWLNYQICSLEKYIRNIELNIYFDRWTGQECIEHNNYCHDKINSLKLKLKNYE